MSYDYRYLQSQHSYEPTQLEKVCRISDTLERITQTPFLHEHLSLYGGIIKGETHALDATFTLCVEQARHGC